MAFALSARPVPVAPEVESRLKWMVVAVLFLGSILNYMDRAVLGVIMPQIKRDLTLSNHEYGIAVNCFLMAYAVFYILGGRLADLFGSRRTFLVTVVVWSTAAMAHALARGLGGLCAARALLGIGEGGFYPAAVRAAAEWFAVRDRAKPIGLFLCGISVGTLLTPPVAASLTIVYGWRAAFLALGALGLVLVIPWLALHRKIEAAYGVRDPAPAYSQGFESMEPVRLRTALTSRRYWCAVLARTSTDLAWFFYLFWLSGYFQEVRGFSLGMVAALLWIPFLAADFGSVGGAWLSSGLLGRGWSLNRARKTVLIPSALLGALGAVTPLAGPDWLALLMVSIALIGHLSWSSNIHTVITEISPARHVAILYGIAGATATVAAALTQPVIGRIVDAAGYTPAFLAAGGAYLMGIVMLQLAGRIEPIGEA